MQTIRTQLKAPAIQRPKETYDLVSIQGEFSIICLGTYCRIEHATADAVKDPDIDAQAEAKNSTDVGDLEQTGSRLLKSWDQSIDLFISNLCGSIRKEKKHHGAHKLGQHGHNVAANDGVHAAKEAMGGRMRHRLHGFHHVCCANSSQRYGGFVLLCRRDSRGVLQRGGGHDEREKK